MSRDSPPLPYGRHGFPLALLFVFVTMATTGGAMLGAVARSAPVVSLREIGYLTAGTVIGLMLFGGIVGLFHFHRVTGCLVGVLAGALVGLVIGPLLAVNENGLQLMFASQTAGAVLIVVTAAILRVNSGTDDLF